MTTFKDRENEFETRFKLDQELQFKTKARRNRLLGLTLPDDHVVEAAGRGHGEGRIRLHQFQVLEAGSRPGSRVLLGAVLIDDRLEIHIVAGHGWVPLPLYITVFRPQKTGI